MTLGSYQAAVLAEGGYIKVRNLLLLPCLALEVTILLEYRKEIPCNRTEPEGKLNQTRKKKYMICSLALIDLGLYIHWCSAQKYGYPSPKNPNLPWNKFKLTQINGIHHSILFSLIHGADTLILMYRWHVLVNKGKGGEIPIFLAIL